MQEDVRECLKTGPPSNYICDFGCGVGGIGVSHE